MTSNNGLGFGGDLDGVHPVVRRFTCQKSIGIGLGLRLGLGLASNFKWTLRQVDPRTSDYEPSTSQRGFRIFYNQFFHCGIRAMLRHS